MSNEGIFFETWGLSQDPRFRTLKVSDIGVLTLKYKIGGKSESLKTPCRIAHIIANGIGIHINTGRLSTKDRKTIERILELETGDL